MNFFLIPPHTKVVTLCRPFGGASLRVLTLCEFQLYLLSSSFFVFKMEASSHQVLADTLSLSCPGHSLMFQSSLFISFFGLCILLTFLPIQQAFLKKIRHYVNVIQCLELFLLGRSSRVFWILSENCQKVNQFLYIPRERGSMIEYKEL